MAESVKVIAKNRRAFRDFEVLDRVEAGIVLRGTEVKSLRDGNVRLTDSYALVEDGEVRLRGMHIPPYKGGSWTNHNPDRTRKLLLHRREIKKLLGRVQEKGLTIIPLSIYFKRGLAKLEIGVARGKKMYDKRNTIKKRDAEREMRGFRK